MQKSVCIDRSATSSRRGPKKAAVRTRPAIYCRGTALTALTTCCSRKVEDVRRVESRLMTMTLMRQRRSTVAQPNPALRRGRRQARCCSKRWRSQGALCAAPWLLRSCDQLRACRRWRRRARFGCAAVLLRCLLRGIVTNRYPTRRACSACFEQLVAKAVRAVLGQFVADLVRSAAFFGLFLDLVVLCPLQTLFCNQTALCSCGGGLICLTWT